MKTKLDERPRGGSGGTPDIRHPTSREPSTTHMGSGARSRVPADELVLAKPRFEEDETDRPLSERSIADLMFTKLLDQRADVSGHLRAPPSATATSPSTSSPARSAPSRPEPTIPKESLRESLESVEFVSHYAEEPIEWSKESRHGRIGPSEGPTMLDGNASIDFEFRQRGPEPPRAADPRGIAEEFRYDTWRRAPARPRRALQLAHRQSDPGEECPLNLFQPRVWPS